MKEPRFYKCAHCGNIITKVEDKGVPVFCCGQKMDNWCPTHPTVPAKNTYPLWK